MSRRNTTDPLLTAFLKDYKLNLLKIPREKAQVGDVYVDIKGVIAPPGRLEHLLVPAVTIPPAKEEKLTSLATTKTRAIELKAGIGLLEGFFSAVGATGLAARIKAEYEHKGASLVRFSLKNATRESVDAIELGRAVAKSHPDRDNPIVQDDARYYVTVAVVRSPSITVTAEDSRSNDISVEAGALKDVISVDGKISVKNERTGELTYDGAIPLAFGVELVELMYDKHQHRFTMAGLDRAVDIREGKHNVHSILVGDPENGDVFLNLQS